MGNSPLWIYHVLHCQLHDKKFNYATQDVTVTIEQNDDAPAEMVTQQVLH